jgi:hypothetical protein
VPSSYRRVTHLYGAALEKVCPVSTERVEYDARAVAREVRNVGLPHELPEQLVRAD